MSFEINPVLAGKFDTPDSGAANSAGNINAEVTGDTGQAAAVDQRRYTQFDRTITDAGTATMSFGDVMDMINPLEHIPVVSSIYRAVVGEEIHPVSRVAGDILYGGVFGIGSAVLGGMGAVADAELAQQTGKDSGGLALAALFGPDDDNKPVQLADASITPKTPDAAPVTPVTAKSQEIQITQNAQLTSAAAALAIPDAAPTMHVENNPSPGTPAPAASIPDMIPPSAPAQVANTASNTIPVAPSPPAPPKPDDAAAPIASSGTIPLLASTGNQANSKTGKQAFGGVMGQPNTQAQDMAIALAQGAPSMKLGHMIYTNPLINGRHPLPPMLSTDKQLTNPNAAPAAVTPAALSTSATDPLATLSAMPISNLSSVGMSPIPTTQLSPELTQDMMLKALSQYRSMATSPNSPGSTLNLTN